MKNSIFTTDNSSTTILIRLIVGLVFLSEGIQKFLFPLERGAGRFEKIGFPIPDFLGDFVGCFEIVCGGYGTTDNTSDPCAWKNHRPILFRLLPWGEWRWWGGWILCA